MNGFFLDTKNLQQRASNPKTSCWVNASAGSGKTKVLIDRIIRLLLHGANPERILCLTFSRAAAGEMKQRLLKRLESISELPEDKIGDALHELGEENLLENILRAKNLYEAAQIKPVTIQTVHSFCQNLLQLQRWKNILTPPPRVMENFEEKTYLRKAFQEVVNDAIAVPYLEDFFAFHTDKVLFDYLSKTTRYTQHKNTGSIKQRLYELFDITSAPEFPYPADEIHHYLKGLLNIEIPLEPVDKDHLFAQCFITQKGTTRQKILPASIQKQYPDAEGLLKNYAEMIAHYFSRKTRFDQLQKSLQFWQLQLLFQKHYKQIKETHNLWDFNDLIDKTLQILKLDDFDQILFELNYRIDHILVDEAQDTSISQWHVIEHLVQGLFYESSRDRSIFVVGDEKQSIYSFQGADVRMYKNIQEHFSTHCAPWENVNLVTSFRSGRTILKQIDTIFAENSIGLGEKFTGHNAYRNFAGRIETLELKKSEQPTIEPWPIFENYPEVIEPEQILAEQVLNHLEKILSDELFLESEQRLASWSDIMILMRKRGKIMQVLTNACQTRRIAHSAFDPKNLLETLVVRDILTIVEFMLMPLNDLNLAALLKSPWMQSFGVINENDLFTLCNDRKGFLWEQVKLHFPNHARQLQQLLDCTPANAYGYFQIAYTAMNTECALLHAFMEDAFKRFNLMNLSIRELVEHLYTYPPIYTQVSQQEGLKISTVHGSKGLEAPIVVILDTGDETSAKQDIILYDPVEQFWFLKPPAAADTVLTAALKEHHQKALEDENNRLFYVALTRAKEHIIMAGIDHEETSASWYWRVKNHS